MPVIPYNARKEWSQEEVLVPIPVNHSRSRNRNMYNSLPVLLVRGGTARAQYSVGEIQIYRAAAAWIAGGSEERLGRATWNEENTNKIQTGSAS